ncbi:WD40 repeat domain-containing protein [Oligoflexus tunisiensis]|uniref:WD40 repeat domain-containing protein n=1 Tax=Oligoflexus tunisiensis TaxID=708132 RepID=UPI00114D0A51|nr:WD40 repeat domain-containing protein [Oligoflexus tunisiensis]
MRQILLVLCVMLVGCQRLRLEVDDLRLRCGQDANLVDVAQWIEPFSALGKPKPTSLHAAVISKDLKQERLHISSKGCIAVPMDKVGWEWLSLRSEEGGIFGKVLKPSPDRYRRVQMEALASISPRFDCPASSAMDKVALNVAFPDRVVHDQLLLNMALSEKDIAIAQLQLSLDSQIGSQFSFDLSAVKEGQYKARITLVDLLNIQNDLKGFERNCALRIDRTAPKIRLMLRNEKEASQPGGLRLGPGEAVEIKVEDSSPARIMSCWTERHAGPCQSFAEAGARLSAPNEGEWSLEYYAIDEAGNTTSKVKHDISIFDADRVGRLVSWIDEARLHLKQESYFNAAKRLYQAAWAMAGLKTEAERKFVQEKLRLPFLSLLPRNVPVNRFRSDDGMVIDLWGVSSQTFVAHIEGDRRLGRILRLHDLTGKIIKEQSFERDALVSFSWYSKKILVWHLDGRLQLYDQNLTEETNYKLNRTQKAEILAFKGQHALLRQAEGLFHLDLSRPQTRPLDKVAEADPAADLSFTGRWLVYQTTDGVMIQDLQDAAQHPRTFAESVESVRFATFVDTLCIKLKAKLKCGQPSKILQNEYLLEGSDALGPYSIHPYGRIIGFAGNKRVYQYDSRNGSYHYKPYLKSIFGLFFERDLLMLESTDGALSWVNLPVDAGEPKPFDPEHHPGVPQTSADNGQITFSAFLGQGTTSLYFEGVGNPGRSFAYVVRGSQFKLDRMALLPDQAHFVVMDFESHINIFSTEKPIFKAYALECLAPSPHGNRCTFVKDGKLYFGEFADGQTHRYTRTGEVPDMNPYATTAWDPGNPNRAAFFYNNEVAVYVWSEGSLRSIFRKEYPKGTWQVKWLGSRYLAISDGNSDIEVWDLDTNRKVLAIADRYNVESMFHIPMDYSPILDTFVVVGKGEDQAPIMEVWKANHSEAHDRYRFTDSDMEYAQIVKFMADGKLMLIGFHHGYLYLIQDVSQSLKPGNIRALKDHQDIISDIGQFSDGKLGYSLSDAGSLVRHHLYESRPSEDIVKTDYLNAGGWLDKEQLFWFQHINNTTAFHDINGRLVERGDVALNFVGELVVVESNGKALFSWSRFDVWQNMCHWSPHLASKAMEDMDLEWKSCDAR